MPRKKLASKVKNPKSAISKKENIPAPNTIDVEREQQCVINTQSSVDAGLLEIAKAEVLPRLRSQKSRPVAAKDVSGSLSIPRTDIVQGTCNNDLAENSPVTDPLGTKELSMSTQEVTSRQQTKAECNNRESTLSVEVVHKSNFQESSKTTDTRTDSRHLSREQPNESIDMSPSQQLLAETRMANLSKAIHMRDLDFSSPPGSRSADVSGDYGRKADSCKDYTKVPVQSYEQRGASTREEVVFGNNRQKTADLRSQEVTAYQKERQQKSERMKMERQLIKDRVAVSAEIEKVIAEKSTTTVESTSDSGSISVPSPQTTTAPLVNAFSRMNRTKSSKSYRVYPIMDFTDYIVDFETALSSVACDRGTERDWQKLVCKAVANSVSKVINIQCHERSHFQTRMNALYALLEIALAVAYTPHSPVADAVRGSHTPGYLCVSMLYFAEKMSESEKARVLSDNVFIDAITQLRNNPLSHWEGHAWNGIDEVLRVLKYPGPVDFRRIHDNDIKKELDQDDVHSGSRIINMIRRKIVDYITHDSCFETKYNALNVLADLGIEFQTRKLYLPSHDRKLLVETLCIALLKITQRLKVKEVQEIVQEFRMDENIPHAHFTTTIDHLLIAGVDTSTFRAVDSQGSLARAALVKLDFKTTEYCCHGLYAKFLYLRWNDVCLVDEWESSQDKIEEALSYFVDTTTPIYPAEYLHKLNDNFTRELSGHGSGFLRKSVDRTIDQITKRSSKGAFFESRMNALKILAKIGLQLVGWLDPNKPFWQTRVFKDGITEDSLTSAMRHICHSLIQDDRSQLLSDVEFMDDLRLLNSLRLNIPDAMLGLDVVTDMIEGTTTSSASSHKRKRGVVIDLTAEPTAKKSAPGTAATLTSTIDLTDD